MASRAGKRPVGRPRILTDSAKKRAKSERNKSYLYKTKIYLGDQYERWQAKKEELGETHAGLAKILLDRLVTDSETEDADSADQSLTLQKKISTPILKKKLHLLPPDVSEISSALSESTDTEKQQEVAKSSAPPVTSQQESPGPSHKKRKLFDDKEVSFINPFDVTIDVTEESSSDINSDEEYEPSFNVTLRPNNMFGLEEVSLEVQEFGVEEVEGDEEGGLQETIEETGSGVTKIKNVEEMPILTRDETCLVYKRCLLKLANTHIDYKCKVKGCNSPISLRTGNIGSALYIFWECTQKHLAHKWCSQPLLNRRLHGGDLQIASAILTSGNNYAKVKLFADFLKLYFPSISKFSAIQRTYLIPTINTFWREEQLGTVESLQGQEIIALGDGRNDSPGHSAQYCTYSIMDNSSKKIISIITMDKRETGKKSTNMEKGCFLKAMEDLRDNGVVVAEVVTDAHLQIGAVMKNRFPEIKHSHDIWHAAKNLGKKVVAAGQSKECRPLLEWSRDIINHFWHACSLATDVDSFMVCFFYIATNWGGPPDETAKTEAPSKAVYADRGLNFATHRRSTAELETFNNLILMYCGKRFAFSPPVYRARSQLAALDYNNNVDRMVKRNLDGTVQQHRTFNKKSGRWSVTPVKVEKSYRHVDIIMERVVAARLNDQEGMSQSVVFDIDDPRRLSRTIAPIDPKPTTELLEEKVSRFQATD
ncbi:uncharacterized protein LOC125649364 [Ostrea edulis]|uniref:uncharacterized protein LOC125649364 n=1 Tax=Ostrea edulis TaxID=37623 RepID=UPI0024AED5C3|nr:uncharacterized protein LOC125649364 [Ostrea edulis]